MKTKHDMNVSHQALFIDLELSTTSTTSARPLQAVGVGVVGAYVGDSDGDADGDADGRRVGVIDGCVVGGIVGVRVAVSMHPFASLGSQGR